MEKNYEDFRDVYDVKFLRKTVATNLQDYGDPIMGEFTSQCRKTVRRSKREGIKVSFDFDGRTIDEFYKIYVSTMDRNNASDFYYFDIDYFYNLFKNLKGHAFVANALLDEKIVGASVILHYGKYIHAHLTGTYPKYLRYSPNNVIKAEVACWGHKNSKKFYHYGGGVGNSESDGLYRYKESFSKNTRFKFSFASTKRNRYFKICI
ncbi:hypothetical protein TSYNTROOL_19730 [Tepidanaerobacter syntrophicus]|uniref:GNAT family N-acetyltransferase n=1 Tax=Tepidanaerobacter syntrophicus TaxID=224999 RepID=UPI0022EE1E1B|nr:GNAT family N-acetyltransferase [Tepidanaerobacter syntrophicus]GLI51887.1 hypothetical protein TSYNTROOL_19730 [Tepidanaerobacter syntrophicus]